MKHLLKLLDCSTEEIIGLLDLADQLKYEKKHNISHRHLEGKSLGMIFQKSSTRTRVSFETGMYQLGGQALFLSNRDLQIGRGEPVQDTARVLSRYLDGIMIRTYAQKEVEDLADYGTIPVINGLTDFCHPCQVLADLMTIREKFAVLEGLKMCYIGDGNNMANSLIVGGLKTGMKVSIASPEGYRPHADVLAFAESNPDFFLTDDPMKAAENADVVITDTWASMGMEAEKEVRMQAFKGYQVNDELLAAAAGLHGVALPARLPRAGDHDQGVRGARGRDLRGSRKPPARAEGRHGHTDGQSGVSRQAIRCGGMNDGPI